MSTSIEIEQSHEKAMRMCQLLKEYTEKFESLGNRLDEIESELANLPSKAEHYEILRTFKKNEREALKRQFHEQYSSINQFIRYCSQQVEHAYYDDLDRYELKMRLSEIESVSKKAKTLIQASPG